MQKLKIAFMATIMAVVSVLTAFAPLQAKADTAWQSTVVASSAVVRFEATPTGFDAASNKYKYQFSWLMPVRKAYSFKIDGKIYMPKVYKNGTSETPFWFSPDVTYHIQIYSYINGRGSLLSDGTFTAPSVTPPTPVTTRDSERQIITNFYYDTPELPTKTVKSPIDKLAIQALLDEIDQSPSVSAMKSRWSTRTKELLDQTPLLLADLDAPDSDIVDAQYVGNIVIYDGMKNASIRVKVTDSKGKSNTNSFYFIKEDDMWKIDFIQILKSEIDASM